MAWTTLCKLDELTEGRGIYAEVDGYHLAVFLHAGEPSVIDDRCPHAGASLSAGMVMNGCVLCPLHEWAFKLSDGTLQGVPELGVRRYPTRIHLARKYQYVQANLPMP